MLPFAEITENGGARWCRSYLASPGSPGASAVTRYKVTFVQIQFIYRPHFENCTLRQNPHTSVFWPFDLGSFNMEGGCASAPSACLSASVTETAVESRKTEVTSRTLWLVRFKTSAL